MAARAAAEARSESAWRSAAWRRPRGRGSTANHQRGLRYLNRLAVLVVRRGQHLHDSKLRARARRAGLQHLALDVQDIARSDRSRPAQVLASRADGASGGLEIAFHEEAHRDRGGMPPTRGEAPKQAVLRRRLVQVKRLRIELRREAFDSLGSHQGCSGTKLIAHLEILEETLRRVWHGPRVVEKPGFRARKTRRSSQVS